MMAGVVFGAGENWHCLRWLEGYDFLWRGEGLDAAVAEPAVVIGEIARRLDGLQVLGVCEIEIALVDAGGLEFVDVSAEKGEGYRARDVDAGVFELAIDEE
jgi:hypothetical protein